MLIFNWPLTNNRKKNKYLKFYNNWNIWDNIKLDLKFYDEIEILNIN